jgi:hypothetical protein
VVQARNEQRRQQSAQQQADVTQARIEREQAREEAAYLQSAVTQARTEGEQTRSEAARLTTEVAQACRQSEQDRPWLQPEAQSRTEQVLLLQFGPRGHHASSDSDSDCVKDGRTVAQDA